MRKLYTLITLMATTTLVAQDLVMTVSVPPGTTSCRFSGAFWGWDPAGGPVGVDNGNDTFTFTLAPAPGADMEYLYTINGSGTYEDLIDNAQNSECVDRVNNGNMNTDFSNFANRIWKTTDVLNWDETYDNCDYTLSNNKANQLSFSLYPNPSKDFTKIASIEPITNVSIYDLGGRRIFNKTPNSNNFEIQTSGLSKGVYIIILNSNDKVATKKLITQ